MTESLNDRVLDLMIQRIEMMNAIGIALSGESDPIRLQERILHGAKALTAADGGTLYSLDPARRELRFEIMHTDSLGISRGGTSGRPIDLPSVPLEQEDGSPNRSSVVAHAVLAGATINIPDAYKATGFDFTGTRAFDRKTGYHSQSLLTIPMRDHEGEIIGVLQLLNALAGDRLTVIPFSPVAQGMAESLASQAAIALSRKQLIDDLQNLFEGFVKLIANAIDEKSPYTGGHCRRVPEIVSFLADAMVQETDGPFAGFRLDDHARYELYLASLLHDCGKITTPEWVMDKATKLQKVQDRIHEVDMRFEVLRRDAEIRRLRALADGADHEAVAVFHQAELEALDDDREFLHRVNAPHEPTSDLDCQRVRRISQRTLTLADGTRCPLLSEEEIGNLCIRRGTLNEDERDIINHHAMATIAMLESLPYPKHLQRIPEYAGNHHERMDGHGYPRGLSGEQMTVQARMMAVADVFEALTAGDRPYKKAIPMSRALAILEEMARAGHLDPDIVAVFLRRRVWKAYGDRFLPSKQMDVR